jgi:titin
VATVGLPAVPAHAFAIYVVTNTNDSGTGSLRQAILDANTTVGLDSIAFVLPGAGPGVITPANDLPLITDPLIIAGYTEPGASPATATSLATITVVIDGTNMTTGLNILTNFTAVSGLNIRNVSGDGIVVSGDNDIIRGNYIGTDETGTTDLGVTGNGVRVDGTGDWVGGPNPADGNVLSGNQGAGVSEEGSDNHVAGNRIGTTADGKTALANTDGVDVLGTGTHVGGTAPGARNIISGNTFFGIDLRPGADDAVVEGNYVGTSVDATAKVPNKVGILVESVDATIGGITAVATNVVSGNTSDGIRVSGVGQAGMQENLIGVTPTGAALGNGDNGVWLAGASGSDVGGSNGSGNTIGGNGGDGVRVDAFDVAVEGNLIGVARNSTGALVPAFNTGNGVTISADDVRVGGDTEDLGNTIGTNHGHGVYIDASGDNAVIRGNHIGTDATGVTLGNLGSGVYIDDFANDNEVGNDAAYASPNNPPNVIAYNAVNGITVADDATGNTILGNSIHDNNALGIDLLPVGGALGVTANDGNDLDVGGNDLQNFPVILGASTVAGVTTIDWRLQTLAATQYRVEFFASPTCDAAAPGNFGEGATFLGSANVTTGPGGISGTVVAPNVTTPPISTPTGTVVVATATVMPAAGGFGDTSEFSRCFVVT